MNRRAWTVNEKALLREQYATRSNAELALDFGRTRMSVYAQAQELGLHKNPATTRQGDPCPICGGTARYEANRECVNKRNHPPPRAGEVRRRGRPPGARAVAHNEGKKKYEGRVCADCGGTVRFVSNRHCICTANNRAKYPVKRAPRASGLAQNEDNYEVAA